LKRPNIPLVDDVEFFFEMEKDFLRQTSATILTARNNREAYEAVRLQAPSREVSHESLAAADCDGILAKPDTQGISRHGATLSLRYRA